MVLNGKKMVVNDWYSMAHMTMGVMAAILLIFNRRQTYFGRTVKTAHCTRKILISSEYVEKTISMSYIKVVYSLILTFTIVYFLPDKHQWLGVCVWGGHSSH